MTRRKNTRLRLTLVCGVCLLLAACSIETSDDSSLRQPNAVQIQPDDPTWSDIAKANHAFTSAWNSGAASKLASPYTTDGKYMDEGIPAAVGRDAIERVFESHFKQFGRTNLSLASVSIWRFGSSLEEEGVLEEKAADGTIIDDGKYIVLWEKRGGKWLLHRDIANSNTK